MEGVPTCQMRLFPSLETAVLAACETAVLASISGGRNQHSCFVCVTVAKEVVNSFSLFILLL